MRLKQFNSCNWQSEGVFNWGRGEGWQHCQVLLWLLDAQWIVPSGRLPSPVAHTKTVHNYTIIQSEALFPINPSWNWYSTRPLPRQTPALPPLDVAWEEPCRLNEYLALLVRVWRGPGLLLAKAGTLMCCHCALSSCSLAVGRHGFPIWDTLMAWKFSTWLVTMQPQRRRKTTLKMNKAEEMTLLLFLLAQVKPGEVSWHTLGPPGSKKHLCICLSFKRT